MSALDKIASRLNERGDVPNQVLAKDLAIRNDAGGIAEIASGLADKDSAVQSDCIKVLYETAYIKPELVVRYLPDFIKLLTGKNNRLVWGAMIGIASVAHLEPETVYQNREIILKLMHSGSVITVDNAVKALALTSGAGEKYNRELFPFLAEHLKTCRPKEVPQHAESIFPAVNVRNRKEFIGIIQERAATATDSQKKRIEKLVRKAEKL